MADVGGDGRSAAGGGPGQQASFNILAQYVKDFSFESPGAPQSLRGRPTTPTINIGVNVYSRPLQAPEYEVELRINIQAVEGETTLFAVELIYAGVFRITNVPDEAVRPLSMIECPRYLFPFARQIISDSIRHGGFPPLMIDPIDFAAMYRQSLAGEQAQGQGQRPIQQ
jgi:preprotein translocase subunit SecB